jgi:hypothetical protein
MRRIGQPRAQVKARKRLAPTKGDVVSAVKPAAREERMEASSKMQKPVRRAISVTR